MSAFKDAVSKDVTAVFLNIEEFADKHVLNDQDVICLVDKDMTTEATTRLSNPLEGVFLNTLTIYVKEKDLKAKPVEGELLYLDGEMYLVRSVSVEMGILVIIVEVHNQ